MQALAPLIFPAMSALVALAFALTAYHFPIARAARWAAIAFFALALCMLIDTQRTHLTAWIVCLVVPLQLFTIAALCQAALVRIGKSMPLAPVAFLLCGVSAVHTHLIFNYPGITSRNLWPSFASALMLFTAVMRLRATGRTFANDMMAGVASWSFLTFAARTGMIACGALTIDGQDVGIKSAPAIALLIVHALTSLLWSLALLLAIGKDLIDAHFRVTQVDPLTGLGNRRALDAAIEADENNGPLYAVAMVLDLDHFKRVNDTHGHEVGDLVLEQVGAALAAQLGAMTLVARIGGEEFAVLVPLAHAELAASLAQVALANLSELRFPLPLTLTGSIGLAHRTRGEDLHGVLRRADAALYRAKANGRNQLAIDAAHEPGERLRAVA